MGGGIGMGNTCKPMAVLFQCMTKFTTNKKKTKNLLPSAGDVREMESIPVLGRSPGGGQATQSSTLAWRIPWTEKPGGLRSIGFEESDAAEVT